MNVVIYSRVSTEEQDFQRQVTNLNQKAEEKGWAVKRVFSEKISGTSLQSKRIAFKQMLEYVQTNDVEMVLVSEISRLGRRVLDVLKSVDQLHQLGIALYVQQFQMVSLNDQKQEDPIFKLLLQMMSIGAEMENDLRKSRQKEGIALAKLKTPEKYGGRKHGAKMQKEKYLKKYAHVAELLNSSTLSLRKIAGITGTSVNTVRNVKAMVHK